MLLRAHAPADPNIMRSRNLSHELCGTREMFARIGRDVDAELAAQAAAEAAGDKAFRRTIFKCPRQFPDPEAGGADADWFFDQTRQGVLTLLLTDLLDMRKRVRDDQKKVAYGSGAYLCFEGQQLACKLIANSTYGATGARRGRISLMIIGATVTGDGKETILNVHARLYERYPNLYVKTFCAGGDTDSVFFGLGHLRTTADVGRWVLEVEAFCNTLVCAPMKIEFEKEFENGYFAVAKKRYATNHVGFDAKKSYATPFDDEDEAMCVAVNAKAAAEGRPPAFDIEAERAKMWPRLRMDAAPVLKCRGMETVRRDTCEFVRATLETVLDLMLAKRSPARAFAHARKAAQRLLDGRVPLHMLVMSKHYSKLVYSTQSLPHLTILKKCAERGLPVPELGSRISFLIVRGTARDKPFERAESVEYVLEHSLPIDYEYYLENQLTKPVLRLLDWVHGFREVPNTRKHYAAKDALKPLLVAPSEAGAGAGAHAGTLHAFFGGARAAPAPATIHVMHVDAARGGSAAVLRAAVGAAGLVYGGEVENRPGQYYVRDAGGAAEPPDALLAEAGITHVATKRVQRADGIEYVSIAHERIFAGLVRGATSAARAEIAGARTAATTGIMRYARFARACARTGCLHTTTALLCDECASERADEARASLDAAVEAQRAAYEATLPVCRRCSGNFDLEREIACANEDCESFYPRRVEDYRLQRARKRRAEGEAQIGNAA